MMWDILLTNWEPGDGVRPCETREREELLTEEVLAHNGAHQLAFLVVDEVSMSRQ